MQVTVTEKGSVGGREVEEPDSPARIRLYARFFGDFEVFCNGTAIDLGRNRRAVAVLKSLLASEPRPVSQDSLMGWLWPDSNIKRARWSLHSTIYALRRLLKKEIPRALPHDGVVLKDGRYRLTPEILVSSDVREFEARYDSGRRLARTGEEREAAGEYGKAIRLYRGDYLVEDLYEDWTMIDRERLSDMYVEMLDRLAVYYAGADRLPESVEARYRLLDKDPCHEESYRALMRSYARLGFRSRALHQYRLCRRMLGNAYGVAPAPETRALYQSILNGENV